MLSDVLIVTDVYPAREEPLLGITGELVSESAKMHGHKNAFFIPRIEDVPSFLKDKVRDNDMVITLGAGDVYKIGINLLKLLEG
jgi:UDP-N-acetylmuramate--alanine ligase